MAVSTPINSKRKKVVVSFYFEDLAERKAFKSSKIAFAEIA